MRIVMMGTGPFAVPTFKLLCSDPDCDVVLLVSQPPREVKGRRQPDSPMVTVARELGVPTWTPDRINNYVDELRQYAPDLLVVCDFGQILSPEVLACAPFGGLNLHGSLLPKYRGAAPVNMAIWNGDAETGNTVIHLTPQLDAGPIVAQNRTAIGADETPVELEPRLSAMGAPLVLDVIRQIQAGKLVKEWQVEGEVSKAPRLKKADGKIDWSKTSEEIRLQIRALEPWPQTFFFWSRQGEPLRLQPRALPTILPADAYPRTGIPGSIADVGDCLTVETGNGFLAFSRIQPSGKKEMDIRAFALGYKIKTGEKLE